MKRTSNPCAATCADGSKCGRRAPLGEQLCSIHKSGPTGKTFQPKPRTPKEIVEKLLTDSEPSVRLRALDMWIKHFGERTSDTGYGELVRLLTDDEKAALREALDWIAAIKEAVYARNADLTPDARTLERRCRLEQAQHAARAAKCSAEARVASRLASPAQVVESEPEPKPVEEQALSISMPFDEPLPGQLTRADVARFAGVDLDSVKEIAPGQFTYQEETDR